MKKIDHCDGCLGQPLIDFSSDFLTQYIRTSTKYIAIIAGKA